MTPLLIRADANTHMGTGHVMRCLALAQAWRTQGGEVTFLSCCESAALRQRIESAGMAVIPLDSGQTEPDDLQTTLTGLEQLAARTSLSRPPWLVLDGYHFDAAYQQAIRTAGYRLLVIDDTACLPQYHANILLNQNIYAAALPYRCDPDTMLLLGPQYALLRPEFMVWCGWQRDIPPVARKILVTMGGSDPDNTTLKVVRALQQVGIDCLEVTIVLGANYLHELRIDACANRLVGTIVRNTQNMPALMAWADVAVSAGGSTCWELAFMGLPGVLVVLAENQWPIAQGLQRAGIAWNMGWHNALSSAQIVESLRPLLLAKATRTDMARHAQRLIDGKGAARVIRQMCLAAA